MRIIPVIDLKQGRVVRAVGGKRSQYAPVRSQLAADCQPGTVAQAFFGLGLPLVYVADLDAIGGAEPDWNAYGHIATCGANIWLDAGMGSAAHAMLLDRGTLPNSNRLAGLVAGLESLEGAQTLADIACAIGPDRLIFSLDLRAGQPLARSTGWRELTPQAIAREAIAAGVRRMIVLDLARVGLGAGAGTEDLCRRLRDDHPDLELIAGGGVCAVSDINHLKDAGCDAALVASALHDGQITARDLDRYQSNDVNR